MPNVIKIFYNLFQLPPAERIDVIEKMDILSKIFKNTEK
jgi:hypothetical protein